jgi:transcriptional regulator with GAF, ATPase, and Fis domain
MNPRLVAITGPHEGRVVEVAGDAFTLGRHATNDLQLRDVAVSRRHCVLEPVPDGLLLRDLGSRHGTFVNGVPVRERGLAHGDLVEIAGSLFLVLLREAPPPEEDRSPSRVRLEDSGFVAESTVHLPLRAEGRGQGAQVLVPTAATAGQLRTLLRLAAAIQATRGVRQLAQRVAALLPEVLPVTRAAVLLLDRPGGEIELVEAVAPATEADEAPISRTLVERVLAERRTILAHGLRQVRALEIEGEATRALAAVACAPLLAGERATGALYADTSDPRAELSEVHGELLAAVAALAAAALENARRVEWLEGETERLYAAELEHDLVGESPAIRRLLDFLARAAPTDSTVLLTGESGTGKELAARALHRNSSRAKRPFVAVNCAVLSESLLASELFGHEKGAFTGAVERKLGKLEVADGGTIFLDEVAETPPALQAQLLRVLEQREIERVGGTRPIPVDVRVVAATNRDLPRAIAEGRFREDLYYRLNVLAVGLPPLRERREDVPLLARHFAARAARKLGRPLSGLARETEAALVAYDWPGNVRELANAIERAVVLGQGEVLRPEDLPEAVLDHRAAASGDGEAATTFHAVLAETKKRLILDAVRAASGNVSEAARRLDLHPNYLHRLISNLGLRDTLRG